jgi:hypothetical protein
MIKRRYLSPCMVLMIFNYFLQTPSDFQCDILNWMEIWYRTNFFTFFLSSLFFKGVLQRAEDAVQWLSACLAWARSWVWSLAAQENKGMLLHISERARLVPPNPFISNGKQVTFLGVSALDFNAIRNHSQLLTVLGFDKSLETSWIGSLWFLVRN